MSGTILVVDDEPDTASLLVDVLASRGYAARAVNSAEACLAELSQGAVDLVVTDVQLGGMSGIELAESLRRHHPEVLSLVVTGAASRESAIEAMRSGAYDYLPKPVRGDALAIAVSRAMDHLALRRELRHLRAATGEERPPGAAAILGSSPAVRSMTQLISRVADSDATVLVTGESGTGKELVARALHESSPRKDEPFVAINCGAMPAELLESELFGHVRGAFTDAKQSRTGLFVQAGGGTILLDEIGEMPLDMQVKLLRVLQERKVRPVGGDAETPVRARVVAATNRDLEKRIAAKQFREDLYYRINVVHVLVPPLRDRPDDILPLAQTFLGRAAKRMKKRVDGLSGPVAVKLREYAWPGNVRELENCMERAVALSRFTEIALDDLPARIAAPPVRGPGPVTIAAPGKDATEALVTIDELNWRYSKYVLEVMGGNKTKAAAVLGIDRRSLYRRLQWAKGTTETPTVSDDAGSGAGEDGVPEERN